MNGKRGKAIPLNLCPKATGLDRPALAQEANALSDKIMHEYRQGVYVEPSEMLLGDYLTQWLEDYAQPNTSRKHMTYTQT